MRAGSEGRFRDHHKPAFTRRQTHQTGHECLLGAPQEHARTDGGGSEAPLVRRGRARGAALQPRFKLFHGSFSRHAKLSRRKRLESRTDPKKKNSPLKKIPNAVWRKL